MLHSHTIVSEADKGEPGQLFAVSEKWPGGRAVNRSIGDLLRDDGMIPSIGVPHLSALETCKLPRVIWFLRHSIDKSVIALSMLWNIQGVSGSGIDRFTYDRLCGDVMHSNDLGVLQRWEEK